MANNKELLYDVISLKKRLQHVVLSKFATKAAFTKDFSKSLRASTFRWLNADDDTEVGLNLIYMIKKKFPNYDLNSLVIETSLLNKHKSTLSIVAEQGIPYELNDTYSKDKEINKLKDQLLKCKDKVIALQEEINELKSRNVAQM